MSDTNIIKKEELVKDQDGQVVSSRNFLYAEGFNNTSILDSIKDMLNGNYVESIDIEYDVNESINEHRNSDKFKDKVDEALLKFNKSKSFEDLKELKFYLNNLKDLIEKCTFQKPVYTETGTYTYEDDIKFNDRLAEVFGCNIKDFKIKVYVSNIDTYYKDREDEAKRMSIEPPKGTEVEFAEEINSKNQDSQDLKDFEEKLDTMSNSDLISFTNLDNLDKSKFVEKDKKEDKVEQEISVDERNKNLFNKYEDTIKNLK